MNRKELLTMSFDREEKKAKSAAPQRFLTTGLAEYAGTWTIAELQHLLRRSFFGYTHADLALYSGKSLSEAVTALLNFDTTAPNPPLNNYGKTNADANVTYGTTWVNALPDSAVISQRRFSFKAWHFSLIQNHDATLREKMVLFWHNHFAAEADSIPDARMAYYLNKIFRDNAIGNFKTLVKLVTLDPMMLNYLNGRLNTKTAPDENYARELQELFTLGKGPDSKYTEDDVKAAAKVLTGWNYNLNVSTPIATFTLSKHDTSNKQFSSFYNNTVITGNATVDAGKIELDALLDMIFANNEVAKFICRKLYRWFCYYEITPETETNVITPLADYFRSNNYNIKLALEKLLKSEHFFDVQNRSCMIKDPLTHWAGFLRQMEVSMPPIDFGSGSDPETVYKFWNDYRGFAALTGLDLGDPPNVAGWAAWYQDPLFYRSWITSDTLPKRNQYQDVLIANGYKARNTTFTSTINFIGFTKKFANPSDANTLISDAAAFLCPMPLASSVVTNLKNILLPGGIPDYNWSSEWASAINTSASDHATALASATAKLKSLYKSIMNLSEYQLS